jgi:lacto-N-biose phosphorylase-like protein
MLMRIAWTAALLFATALPLSTSQVARPAFAAGQGPVVAIDERHHNTHTYATDSFRGLLELLSGDGYRVRPFTDSISSSSLRGVDVLVISGPGGWSGPEESLSTNEVTQLLQWVRQGGSLLLILDHMPAPRHGASFAAALGVGSWHDGYAQVEMPDSRLVSAIVFWRADSYPAGAPAIGPTGPRGGTGYQGADATLAKHPITEGRNADERVRRVATFGGSAFRPPAGATPLLTLPERAVSLTPPLTPNALPDINASTPRTRVGGWLQGAVTNVSKGRVALFGETGLFSGGPAADNRQFVLNVTHWLSGLL